MPNPFLLDRNSEQRSGIELLSDILGRMEAEKSGLVGKFDQWRQDTLHIIDTEHSDHPCHLMDIRPKIETVDILFGIQSNSTRAWAIPNLYKNKMWVNAVTQPEWNQSFGIRSIVHECLHLGNIQGGTCGPDSELSPTPLCYLWGKPVFVSTHLDVVIYEHLLKYSKADPPIWNQRELNFLKAMTFFHYGIM